MKTTYRWLLAGGLLGGLLLSPNVWHRLGRIASGSPVQALASDDVPATRPDAIRRVWAVPVDGYRAAAASPDGTYIGLVSGYVPGKDSEKLSLWRWQTRPDHPLWSRPAPGISAVAVGAGGQALLTCARMNAALRTVALRKGDDGAQAYAHAVDGPIWDMRTSDDGLNAALTTGGHSLYFFSLERPVGFHRWALDGIGNAVALTDTTYLATGTWDRSGVSCYTLSGTKVWEYPRPGDPAQAVGTRLYETQIAQQGQYVLGVSYTNAHRNDGCLYLWRADGDGTPLWTHALGVDAAQPKAMISADGRTVAVTFTREVTRGGQHMAERRLLVLDRDGNPVWEKGNLLFAPTLIALAPDGSRVTVSNGGRTLYNLNAQGRVTAVYPMKDGAAIREVSPTPDGRSVLVYTSNGLLNLFQIG